MFSEWRSIRPVEFYEYDITLGNDIARDARCEITMGNEVARDIHCDVTMSYELLFYYVFSALCLFVLFYYGQYGIKTRTFSCLISLHWRRPLLFLCRVISLILWTRDISLHKHVTHVFSPELIKHSLVLVIVSFH